MPINTPDTNQDIAAQEQARTAPMEAANLPSPGALPVPQVSPIPIPGTGLTTPGNGIPNPQNTPVNGTNVDADFLNKVLGAKEQPYKVGNLPTFTEDQVYNPRYKSIQPGEDSEEVFAQTQPWTHKWGNAFVKMAATAIGTFWNGITSIPDTIAHINDKEAWNTDAGKGIDSWLKNLEDEFPNYYTKWEQAHPFKSALPFSGGFANFWGDKMLKNFGFTIGAIGSAAVTDLAVGTLTDGIGEIPLIGNQIGRAALWINKIFTGENKVQDALALGQGLGASADELLSMRNLQRAAQASKIYDGTRYATNLYAASASEAGFEARDGYNTVRNDLILAYKNEKGFSPVGKDLDDIEANAKASANVRFGINMVLLSASNAIQWDSFIKPFGLARKGAASAFETELGEAGKIGIRPESIANGTLDVDEIKRATRMGRFLTASKPYIADILSEGVYEEGGQYAAQVGTQNYYERKYLAQHGLDKSGYGPDQTAFDSRYTINNLLHSTIKGMQAEFTTDEGLENVLLGALTGVISKGGRDIYDRFKGNETAKNTRQTTISMLNTNGITGSLQNNYDNATTSARIAEDMKRAVKTNDVFQYKNFQHEQFTKSIISGLQAGRYDVRTAQMDLLTAMPEDKFKQAFGLDKTSENVKTAAQYVDLMKTKAESIKSSYELIDQTFQNPFVRQNVHKNGILTEEQEKENDNYENFNKLKGDMTWIASIQNDANQRLGDINDAVKKIDPRIDTHFLSTLTNGKSLREYSSTLAKSASVLRESAKLQEGNSSLTSDINRRASLLENRVKDIDSALKSQHLSNSQYEKVFTDLLNHSISDDNLGVSKVPIEAIPQLITFGRDSNRLNIYKQDAADKFEALVTEKGFQKYFDDIDKGRRDYTPSTNFDINAPGESNNTSFEGSTQQTATGSPNTPNPPEARKINITSSDGKTSKVYEENKFYPVKNEESGEFEPTKIISSDGKGNITVENEDGERRIIASEQLFIENPIEKDINDIANEEKNDTPPEQVTPTPPTNESNSKRPNNNDGLGLKKDITIATRTSTAPNYHSSAPYNNFHRRESNYLYNLGSSDPKVFNQENKDKLRVIYVNKKIAEILGFPKDFIATDNDVNQSTIRIVHVIEDRNKDGKTEVFFADDKGNKLQKVEKGANPDPNNIIFTTAPSTELTYPDGKPIYVNNFGSSEEKIQNEWREKRRQILAVNSLENTGLMNFNVSRGIINAPERTNKKGETKRQVDYDTKNPVTKVGLIKEEDMDKSVISIPTKGRVTVNVIGQIGSIVDGITYSKGRKLLNSGLNVTWLNAKIFTAQDANNIYDILHHIANKVSSKEEKSKAIKYLKGVIYTLFSDPGIPSKFASDSSITFAGMDIFLGKSTQPIFQSQKNIEKNKDKIIDFLTKSYHDIDNSLLNKIANNTKNAPSFTEYKVEDNKLVEANTWKNYNYYLLSDKDPQGKERGNIPFTSNIDIPTEGETPLIQKYVQVVDEDFDSSKFKVEETQQPVPIAAKVETKSETTPENKEKNTQIGVKPSILTATEALSKLTNKVATTIDFNGIKVLIGDLVKDTQGNIVDFTLVGKINEDNTVTPSTSPQTKELILRNLNDNQIQVDDSNKTSETKNAFNDILNDPDIPISKGDVQYRTAFGQGNYQKANIDEEFETFKDIVGDKYTLNKLDHLLRKTGGGFAWGAVQGSMLYVYDQAEVGTLYHEAFEAVWGNFLTGKEQADLYNEFSAKKGQFKTLTGETKDYSEATLHEIKEQLAEDFRDYRLSPNNVPTSPKALNFFQKLVQFIKRIIFGDPDKIKKLYERMNQGYYRNYNNNELRNLDDPQYRDVNLQQFSEQFIQDTIQGMTVEMFQQIYREGSDVITMLEEKPKLASKVIYSNLQNRLKQYFEGKSDNSLASDIKTVAKTKTNATDLDALGTQYAQAMDGWNKINANWDSFVREHKKYLRIFSVEFKVDDEGNVDIEDKPTDEDNSNKNQSEYARDHLLVDAKNSTSTKIKLLLASIADSQWAAITKNAIEATDPNKIITKRDNSVVSLPKQAQYAKLFNYLLHSSANIGGGIYNIYQNLKERVSDIDSRKKIDANVQRVLNRINFDNGFIGKSWSQVKLLLSFEAALNKTKPGFFRQFKDQYGDTYFKTSLLNSKTSQVKASWISGIKSSDLISSSDENPNFFSVNSNIKTAPSNNIEFLNSIGIPITKSEYSRVKGDNKTKFDKAANAVRDTILSAGKKHQVVQIVSAKGLDFDNRLTKLAEVYINTISGDDTQSQHPNLDNEQTSSFVLGNFVTTQLNDAATSENMEDFLNHEGNQYLTDVFHKDGNILNNLLFDKETSKPLRQVEFGYVEGLQSWNGKNTSQSKMVEAMRSVYEINNNLNGIFYTLLPADAKSEAAVRTGTFIDPVKFFQGTGAERQAETNKYLSQMYKWLQTEIDLAKDFKTNSNRRNIVQLNSTSKFDSNRTVGNSLRFFQDLLPEERVRDINKDVIDGNKTIEEVLNKEDFNSIMRESLQRDVDKVLNYMIDNKIFSVNSRDTNKIQLYGIDKEFINENLGNSYTNNYDRKAVVSLLAFREMNYVINNIDMHKMFFGDPAQYKDELKRIKSFLSGREQTHVDTVNSTQGFNEQANIFMNKAGKLVTSGEKDNRPTLKPEDPGYQQHKNHFNTFTLRDVITASSNERKDYESNNEADSIGYVMPGAYRELMMKAAGRWTDAQENQFQRDQAWTRTEMEKDGLYTYTNQALKNQDMNLAKESTDPSVAYQPLKPIHSGMQFVGNTAVASIDKFSLQMLNYKWFKNKGLGKLYLELQKRGTDYVRMESAHKVGIQSNSLTDLYDSKGEINTEGISKLQDEKVSLKHLGIQVEQQKKEKGVTEGSQARKLAMLDFMNNGVGVDFASKYSKLEDAQTAWDNLTEEEKQDKSPIYKKTQRWQKAIVARANKSTDLKLRKLGVVKNEDGTFDIPNKQKLSDFIFRELERRELPRNIAYGLEINPETGDFAQPLEANAQYQKIRQVIYSTIDSTIQRPKFNGGQKTMVSVTGMETGPRIIKKMVNGKPVYTADILKTYELTKNGKKIRGCEVMLPYMFTKKLMAAGSKRTQGEILKHLNETEEGKKLLEGMGFRIPTQGMNSIDFFTIKEFLPENMGDVIVLPSEITTKAGSDFDIDKLNVYLRNFYIDKRTGYPTLIPFIDTQDEQKLRDYYESHMLENHKKYEQYLKDRETLINSDKFVNAALAKAGQNDSNNSINLDEDEEDDNPNTEEPDYVPTIDEFLLQAKGGDPSVYNSKESLENEYFDSLEDLISDPLNYDSLTQPNSADYLKGLRDEVLAMKAESLIKGEEEQGNVEASNQPYGKLLDPLFMMKERQAYISSKSVVGIAAVANTFHAMSQGVQGTLEYWGRKDFNLRTKYNTSNGNTISLSGKTIPGVKMNSKDMLISNIISQMIDGGVDVAKDKFLADMGITRDTIATVIALVRMGVNPRWAIMMINQPIVQEYLKQQGIQKSMAGTNPNVPALTKKELRASMMHSPKFNGFSASILKQGPPANYSISEMEEMLKAKSLNGDQKARQQQILDDYLQYVNMGWDLFNFYSGYNWDTGQVGDPNITRLKNLAYAKANSDELPMTNVSNLVNNSFIGGMRDNILKMDQFFKSAIRIQRGKAGDILDIIARSIFGSYTIPSSGRADYMLKRELSMVDYTIQNSGKSTNRPIVDYMSGLLMGKTPINKYINAIKNSKDKRLANNPFIKNLLSDPDKRPGYPNLVRLIERDYDTYTSNVWTSAIRELKADNTVIKIDNDPTHDRTVAQIAENLTVASILQFGSKRSSNSLTHLLPNEMYSKHAAPALELMNLNNYLEVGAFERNNARDAKVVPSIRPFIMRDENDGQPIWYSADIKGFGKEIQRTKGGNFKIPQLLNLAMWQTNGNKFVSRVNSNGQTELFQLVQTDNGPLTLHPNATKNFRAVYKQINAWGYGINVQEYHQEAVPSILNGLNPSVNELDDNTIIATYQKLGVATNALDDYSEVANLIDDGHLLPNSELHDDYSDAGQVSDDGEHGGDSVEDKVDNTPTTAAELAKLPAPEVKETNNNKNMLGNINSSASEYTNHSGGAIGADTQWDEIGQEFGVTKHNHYYAGAKTPNGNIKITDAELEEGWQHVLEANKTLKRRPENYKNLLSRNWIQVKNADSVFAISSLKSNTEVNGGTGWAVQMAIDANKPVYVFDQNKNTWNVYNQATKSFDKTSVPKLTKNFAGIGTRDLNDAGKTAIRNVYINTFNTGSGINNSFKSYNDPEQDLGECKS